MTAAQAAQAVLVASDVFRLSLQLTVLVAQAEQADLTLAYLVLQLAELAQLAEATLVYLEMLAVAQASV